MSLFQRLKDWAKLIKREVVVVALAAADPRTPFWPRAVAVVTAAYALSPIDLIPDFIPVLGYLDDLILVPAGIALVLRLLPPALLADLRARAEQTARLPKSPTGALIVTALWLATGFLIGWLIWRRMR